LACKGDLQLPAEWCRRNVVLETDCSSLVSMLGKREGQKSQFKFIIDESHEAGSRLPEWEIVRAKL
ncbi:hypothetical protein BAE44_0008666, partial [Dichanthelium oligosanthes]